MTMKEVYKFKKGQKIHLDEIYHIQGLASDWFEEDYSPDISQGPSRKGLTDYLVVTKNIKFTIIIEEKL